MTEVSVKLSELRYAADQMYRSGLRIEQSVQEVTTIIAALLAAGFRGDGAASLTVLSADYCATMENWSRDVRLFATRLNEAADDIEQAIIGANASEAVPIANGAFLLRRGASFVVLMRQQEKRKRELDAVRKVLLSEPEPLPLLALGDYVSRVNRPLYDLLLDQKRQFASERTRLDILLQTRQRVAEDLIALKNRLTSYDPNVDLARIPRVRALEQQIGQLDGEITNAQGSIHDLQTSIDDLAARLDRVKPGPGADLNLIMGLENGQTVEWVKANTQDCVNYIVNKMPIPEGIASNAYLWDDRAAQFAKYGITSGDTPLVGSVVVLEREHSYADDVFGHLMVVERVEDGAVWVTDNRHPDWPVKLSSLTDELTGPNIKYLYFPWHTRA